jgi:hypothetical protein
MQKSDSMETEFKLFMVLLGSKAPGRLVEQHDYFFGIASRLKDLVPDMHKFWPEAGDSLHIDGWREVTRVEGYNVKIVQGRDHAHTATNRLFFINLGGYHSGKLEEQHYTLLTVQPDRKEAIKTSTSTAFFKQKSIAAVKTASAHIDEKYGIDVDDIYRIEDVLSGNFKLEYHIELTEALEGTEDEINLGYFRLDRI